MKLYTHILSEDTFQSLGAKSLRDPVTGETLRTGQEVVFCANCKSAFLKESWEYMGGEHCGQKEVLKHIPSFKELILWKENTVFRNQGSGKVFITVTREQFIKETFEKRMTLLISFVFYELLAFAGIISYGDKSPPLFFLLILCPVLLLIFTAERFGKVQKNGMFKMKSSIKTLSVSAIGLTFKTKSGKEKHYKFGSHRLVALYLRNHKVQKIGIKQGDEKWEKIKFVSYKPEDLKKTLQKYAVSVQVVKA